MKPIEILAREIKKACENGASESDIIELLQPIIELKEKLERINKTIYATGAPLGSNEYFEIRELAIIK